MSEPVEQQPAEARVNVVNEHGRVVSIPESQAGQALESEGYRLAGADEVKQARLERDYGGAGHQVGALLSGAASGASLGMSDVVIGELGGRDALQAYEQVHGGLRGAGELAGSLAGLGKLGAGAKGASLAARAAKGAGSVLRAPARAAFKAGQATEGLVAAKTGSKFAGLMAGASAEGALYGAGAAISESAIYDTQLTGERLAAQVGRGALFGAAGAGVLGGGARLLGAGARKGASLIQRALKGADGNPGALAKLVAGSSSVVSGAPREAIERLLSDADYRKLAVGAGELGEKESAKLLDALEGFHRTNERMRAVNSGAAKADEVAATITRGNEANQTSAFRGMADELSGVIDNVKASKDAMSQKGVNKLSKSIKQFEATVRRLESGKGDIVEAYMKADAVKRSVGDAAYSKLGASVSDPAERALYDTLDGLYEKQLRPFLENDALFGQAGARQKAINAAWAPFIQEGGRTGIPQLLAKTRRGFKGAKVREFNRERVAKALQGLGKAEKEQLTSNLIRYLEHGDSFISTAKAETRLSGRDKALASSLGDDIAQVRESVSRLQEMGRASDDLAALKAADTQNQLMGQAAAYAVGSGALGPLAGVGAVAHGVVSNPYGIVTKMAAIESMASRFASKTDGAASKLIDKAARQAYKAPAELQEAKDSRRTFSEVSSRLQKVAGNRQAAESELRKQVAGFADGAPQAANALVATQMAKYDYLLRRMPHMNASAMGREPSVSRVEADRFMRSVRALEDPTVVLDDAIKGQLNRETVEAVKAVYPSMFAEMQSKVMDEYADLAATGKQLPYAQRLQIGTLLEIPTDPSLEPDMIAMQQGLYAANPEPEDAQPQQAPPGTSPQLSHSYKTDAARLEETA